MDIGEIRSLLFLSVQIIHRFCFAPEHFDGESSCKNSLFCFYFYYLNFRYSFTEMKGNFGENPPLNARNCSYCT